MSFKVVFLLALVAAVCAKDIATFPCPCAKIYLPVCASNRVTYNNMCEYQCAAKQYADKYGKDLSLLFQGRCDGKH